MGALLLAGSLSSLIGAVLGLLGGGGGILAVPLLVYVVGVGAKAAIAASLFFVGVTSAFGTALAAREGRVRWKIGGIFGAGSMSAAFVGGTLARFVPDAALLGGLAVVMLATGLAMLKGRSERAGPPSPVAVGRVLPIGVAVGLTSGLVGAGGGFLIVPALTLFGGLAMRDAIGTSLFIIAMQSFAGFAGHASHVELSVAVVAVMTAAALVGMAAGRSLGKRIPAAGLRRAFAGLVLATGLFMVERQLAPGWTGAVAAATIVLALAIGRRRAVPFTRTTDLGCTTSAHTRP